MNERLEKELESWRHEHFQGKRDGDYSGEYLERESQLSIARHFYSLALENVRKECEKYRTSNMANHILDFIEQLSK